MISQAVNLVAACCASFAAGLAIGGVLLRVAALFT